MKRLSVLLVLLLSASALFASDDEAIVHWKTIVGVITAPGISNTVAGIASGGPWRASRGNARVNLETGDIAFKVEGLVLVGGNSSGTRGGVASVKGTLVCNPGTATQAVLDTDPTPLSLQGDAQFHGNLGTVPPCDNPLFLLRPGAAWIATGAVRGTGDYDEHEGRGYDRDRR